jgi:hypothetical protein
MANENEIKPTETAGGSLTAYRVEARCDVPRQAQDGTIFGTEWRVVTFNKSSHGVPIHDWRGVLSLFGDLLTYEAAQSLRWWFVAAEHAHFDTRIVPYKVSYEAKSFKQEPVDAIGAHWNKPMEKAK